MEWFEQNLICRVPDRYAGAGRQVYPGFLQLMAFISMNMDRHVRSFVDLYRQLVEGDSARARACATQAFYEEYFAVLDLPAPFFLETVRTIFQEHALPRRQLTFRGRKVNPAAITRTALLTVEGERDDICAIGQTLAAHDLCAGVRPYLKTHYIAGWRRSLWCVQRPQMDERHLSRSAGHDAGDALVAAEHLISG